MWARNMEKQKAGSKQRQRRQLFESTNYTHYNNTLEELGRSVYKVLSPYNIVLLFVTNKHKSNLDKCMTNLIWAEQFYFYATACTLRKLETCMFLFKDIFQGLFWNLLTM